MRKSDFIVLALCAFFIFSCNSIPSNPSTSNKKADVAKPFAAPRMISIAGLPDSLQPKTISLDKMPKPLKITVPKKEGGFYNRKYANGDFSKIMLSPPAKKMVVVLLDEKGRPVKDKAGKSFVMGAGGHSNFTNFNSDDGLALNGVNCSMLDRDGNLWFGTQGGGASKYDGKSFTTFSTTQGLRDGTVTSLYQDRAGNIWMATQSGGASKYDGSGLTNFTIAQGLPSDQVTSIFEDRSGTMWFGEVGGVSRYDGKSFTNFSTKDGLPNNQVTCIHQDKSGSIWFGTLGGVSRYDGKSFFSYTLVQGLGGLAVFSMAEARDGAMWFGTDKGISKYDGKTFVNFSAADGLSRGVVQAISEDRSGNLWFGTSEGLSRYDGKTFTDYTTAQGLAGNNIRCITEDRAGNLWIGTFENGVSKYGGNAITTYTSADGIPAGLVFYINQDREGNYWFCTTDGLCKYDGKSFTKFTVSQGLARNNIQYMTQDRSGNIWFGADGRIAGGMSKYDGRSFTTFTMEQGLPANNITGIVEDGAGNLWLSSYGGLTKFNGNSFTNYSTTQGLIHNNVNVLCLDKDGTIWAGTNAGVTRFDGKTFINFTKAQGLSDDFVNSITQDKSGNIWIGTEVGLSRLSPKEQDKLKSSDKSSTGVASVGFDNFTTAQGLADDNVTGVVEDKHGNIFVGTNLGFTVIPAESTSLPFAEVGRKLEYYNRPSGFPVRDINTLAMYYDSNGVIWAGTSSGLVRFDYSSLHKEAGPTLAIQKIKVNGENICWFDLLAGKNQNQGADSAQAAFQESMAYGKMIAPDVRDSVIKRFTGIRFDSISRFSLLPQNLELPYAQNRLTIDFNAVETSQPQLVEYQFKLQGYDKDWSPVTKITSATFGNMYEGSYTFMVRARKSNGDWSEPVTYAFKVLPPWYRSWWAYLLYALCLIAAIFVIDRIRRKVVEERLLARTRETELAQAREIEKAYTELKATQAQLIQSEKMASLGELTAGIAHEIQNPLNFMNNFSEVNKELLVEMKDEMDKGNAEGAKSIANSVIENEEKINRHGRRADAIVKGMLQHTRSSTGLKEPTLINVLADEYLKLAYHGFRAKDNSINTTINTEFDKSIGKVNIMPQEMGRVLLNIYNNAFYAVGEKKKLHPENYEPSVSLSTKKSGNQLLLSVKDNGNGIPQHVVDKIFQPFFTTKPTGQGTGLGLSLSYDIVKAHGGEIKVETKEGGGTTFLVQLPVA
jgi:ligand-binding sensor domain-containing protein/signal transduction histidine kinase